MSKFYVNLRLKRERVPSLFQQLDLVIDIKLMILVSKVFLACMHTNCKIYHTFRTGIKFV